MKKLLVDVTRLKLRSAVAAHRVSILLLALLCIGPLNAGVLSILYETRPYTGGNLPTAVDYVNNWNALLLADAVPPAGYGSAYVPTFLNLSNQGTFGGSSTDIGFHTLIMVDLTPAQAGIWNMQFGIDYGLGGALFVDGNLVDFRNTDMWWNGSFSDPNQLLTGIVNLAAGAHTVELFGLEACCDGPTGGRYQIGGQPTLYFSTLPEPGTAIMIALAFGVLALRSRARR